MTKILYIGNVLSKHGYNKSTIETLGPLLSEEGYKVITSSSQKNSALRLLSMVVSTIRNTGSVDYVMIDTYSTLNFWYAFIISQICRVFKIKYIPILHGGMLPQRIEKNPLLSEMIFKNAYINSVPSQFLYQKVIGNRWNNIVNIPNQIEIKEYSFKKRIKFQPKILWVRSLSDIYNPTMAIDVAEKVNFIYPEIQLCMVGPENGLTIKSLSQYAHDKNLNVTFTGKLSKSEWIKLSENYDIFINTTHFDNTPVSLIEALALGLPVVSTNVGGIPYLVKDRETAILVDDSDVQAMADAIIELITNPELAHKLATNGRKLVEQFDWQIIKSLWKEILK
ncbi:glycosyltransferase family 4 protein [Flavobacterium sp.]|uniref:glycosyltransferase family 4 protein n=1 Tax=Flavobacterium sp. TaxID=239 RepID=UPI003529D2BE